MSAKRMFDKAIIDTDRFMDLPMSAKALYFLLGMEADDEGFVSPKKVIRIHGGNEDDVKILTAKEFVIQFQSGVVVITDWNKNNWLDGRRTKPTEYQREKKQLALTENKEYVLSNRLANASECLAETQENGSKSMLSKRLASREENSIEESRIEEKHIYGEFENVKLSKIEHSKLVEKLGEKNTKILIEELSGYMASKKTKYVSHYATILNWARRKIEQHNTKKVGAGAGIAI